MSTSAQRITLSAGMTAEAMAKITGDAGTSVESVAGRSLSLS